MQCILYTSPNEEMRPVKYHNKIKLLYWPPCWCPGSRSGPSKIKEIYFLGKKKKKKPGLYAWIGDFIQRNTNPKSAFNDLIIFLSYLITLPAVPLPSRWLMRFPLRVDAQRDCCVPFAFLAEAFFPTSCWLIRASPVS